VNGKNSVHVPRHRRDPAVDLANRRAAAAANTGYLPQIDGLRALAILAVLLLHASVTRFPGGWIGVHIFFVLSGYLITTLLLREWDKTGRIGLGRFYVRRVLRLVPAYWLVLLAFVLSYVLSAEPADRPALWREFWIAATYRTNFMFDQSPHLGFTWTLAMEEQFYLVWPLILVGLLTLGLSRRRIVVVTVGLCLAVEVWRAYLLIKGADYSRLNTGPDVQADALLLGCIAAQVQFEPAVRRLVASPAVPWIGCALIGAFILGGESDLTWLYGGPLTAVYVTLAVLLLNLVQQPGAPIERVLSSRIPVLLGKISYSVYLWNVFALELARRSPLGAGAATALGLVLAVLGAILTYRLVEIPFRHVRRRLLRETAPA
jgi:peptidoglycan/LPS O-acetylase OafA/YrhL